MPKKPRTIKAWAIIICTGEIQFEEDGNSNIRIFRTRQIAQDRVYQTEIGEKVASCEIKLLTK